MLKRWIVVGVLALLVSVVALLIGVQASAAQEATESPTQEVTISPALSQQMTTLEHITQSLRGLTAKSQIDHRFPTRADTIAYLQSSYDREFPPAQFDRLKRFYVALNLLPADTDLRAVYLSLLDEQVAGYYDPDTKTMNVLPTVGNSVGDSLSFTEQITYVHEFTHALQDQYFNLNKLENDPGVLATPDRSLALTSLIEGDATNVMSQYAQAVVTQNPLAAVDALAEGALSGGLSLPPGIPTALVDELLFPYEAGLSFNLALYNEGGWDAVNAAFAIPPTTSEQIIHPEKYIAGEGAQSVTLADESTVLGTGWTDVWDTTLGEFYLREALSVELNPADAGQAADGWGGDHFRVYQNGDQGASALRITWDSKGDHTVFDTLYGQYADKRFGTSADANGCWQDSTGALCLVSNEQGDLIVTAPTVAQAQALEKS